MLNYHRIWPSCAISIEGTPRFVTCKFYTKTEHQWKSNKVTVASVNAADELISLLIVDSFVNWLIYWLIDWPVDQLLD